MADATDRKTRASQERSEVHARPTTWKPPSLLPVPPPEEGWVFRYIRASMLGKTDNVNVSAKFREGWEPVRAADYPDLQVIPDHETRFPENIEVGGLILCKCPADLMRQRQEYYQQKAQGQMQAVDDNYLRESDPRMPMLKPERTTRVSRFGN